MTSASHDDDLAVTVVEVVALNDVPDTIRDMATPVVAEQGVSWQDVSCVARVRKDEPRPGEEWLVAVHSTNVRVGSRLCGDSRWAAFVHRYDVADGEKRTTHWIDVVERVSGPI